MRELLQVFIWLPLIAFVAILVFPRKKERVMSQLAIGTVMLHCLASIVFTIAWIADGAPVLDIKHIVLYKTTGFEFFIDFYFDRTSAVFLTTGSMITLLVAIFSRYYMHRDEGFKRYFATFMLFFLGYNLVILGGNLETLFIGWETLGFCSFLLIAFYRDRWLPVKNALKVISVYRLGDVCIMLAMWMCHHIFHQNIVFSQLNEAGFVSQHQASYPANFLFVAIMLVIAAAAKSAIAPFTSWLPRAMEGPTTSSAVFYGSLSLHLGVFLLLRTFPLWESIELIKWIIVGLGIITAVAATAIARVQSTVKTQIAYASATQVGLMFIEVAMGWHVLALIHFAGNAFLRTYQLLVSPSVLSYRIHDMFFHFRERQEKRLPAFQTKILNTLYIFSIREWNMDTIMRKYLWDPFKIAGRNLRFFARRASLYFITAFLGLGLFSFASESSIDGGYRAWLPVVFATFGLMLILTSFSDRGDARRSWLLVLAAQCFITLSIALNANVPLHQLVMYLSGPVLASVAGLLTLNRIHAIDRNIHLDRLHGYVYERPVLSFIFLLACLASLGFPFTTTFLGIDLLFTHLRSDQYLLIALTALSFIFIELSLLRIYARVFLGPHKRNDHPIAYRSS